MLHEVFEPERIIFSPIICDQKGGARPCHPRRDLISGSNLSSLEESFGVQVYATEKGGVGARHPIRDSSEDLIEPKSK